MVYGFTLGGNNKNDLCKVDNVKSLILLTVSLSINDDTCSKYRIVKRMCFVHIKHYPNSKNFHFLIYICNMAKNLFFWS